MPRGPARMVATLRLPLPRAAAGFTHGAAGRRTGATTAAAAASSTSSPSDSADAAPPLHLRHLAFTTSDGDALKGAAPGALLSRLLAAAGAAGAARAGIGAYAEALASAGRPRARGTCTR